MKESQWSLVKLFMCLHVIVKGVVTVRDPASDQLGSEPRFLHLTANTYWSLTVRTYLKLLYHLKLYV